jgi:CcmD family protein
MPALPLDSAGPYVAGAFVVLFALVLVYLAIMASRLVRIERELSELTRLAEQRPPAAAAPDPEPEEARV